MIAAGNAIARFPNLENWKFAVSMTERLPILGCPKNPHQNFQSTKFIDVKGPSIESFLMINQKIQFTVKASIHALENA